MSLAISRFSPDEGGAFFQDALYRLTGFGFFSPDARARRARYERTLSELERMNGLELAELGIQRCDIRRVARETAAVG